MVGEGYATLHEMQTVYGLKDLYDMLEMIAVRKINEQIAARHAEAEAKRRG